MSDFWTIILLLVAASFGVFLWIRLPQLAKAHGGRVLLMMSLLVLPVLLMGIGVTQSLRQSQDKEFCTSCHEMQVYDTSLRIDDPEYIPAVHYQNRLVPHETACYTCHTDYTLYGDLSAKFTGFKHVLVHFFGDVPEPGEIELYSPYPNDNCLKCHRGSRRFEKKSSHKEDGLTIEALYANEKSCIADGCHDRIHDIARIGGADIWGEPPFPIPQVLLDRAPAEADDPFAAEDPFAEEAQDPFADEAEPDAAPKTEEVSP